MTAIRHILGAIRPSFLATAACLALAGCASKKDEVWIPPPQVHWEDVSDVAVPPVRDEYVILESKSSEGRFPCSIAVSRIAIELDDKTGQRRRIVPITPHNEFLIWNSAFDDLWPVSEVFPIAQRALGGASVKSSLVVDVAHAFHARMSLIYGFNVVTPTQCEMLGVVHEAAGGKPIAVIHAGAVSIPRPEDDKPAKHNIDAWEYDARALVRTKFERLMVSCMRELIARDTPKQVDVPEGWTPVRPNCPMGWPPRSSR